MPHTPTAGSRCCSPPSHHASLPRLAARRRMPPGPHRRDLGRRIRLTPRGRALASPRRGWRGRPGIWTRRSLERDVGVEGRTPSRLRAEELDVGTRVGHGVASSASWGGTRCGRPAAARAGLHRRSRRPPLPPRAGRSEPRTPDPAPPWPRREIEIQPVPGAVGGEERCLDLAVERVQLGLAHAGRGGVGGGLGEGEAGRRRDEGPPRERKRTR
ncbi:hypothetical protein C2845_PM11G09490 [Panicum miliaceum]|uniref:Uncharacterized protein n=1 Tax=Panicum miliaceum TaxID=4540 RepID=A0A3L6RV69_PANMI|nr:hypothetical protein C2845_PM11G09490 [Panicum miliaceum]